MIRDLSMSLLIKGRGFVDGLLRFDLFRVVISSISSMTSVKVYRLCFVCLSAIECRYKI